MENLSPLPNYDFFPLWDKTQLVQCLENIHNQVFPNHKSIIAKTHAQAFALALLWDDLKQTSPYFYNPSLSKDPFGSWVFSFVINTQEPMRPPHSNDNFVLLKFFITKNVQNQLLSMDLKSHKFPKPFFHELVSEESFNKTKQIAMLTQDILFPDIHRGFNPHPVLENFLRLFTLPPTQSPFDLPTVVPESKLFLAQKKFPDLWEPIIKQAMKQAIKSTLPVNHTLKTPKKMM